MNRGKVFILVVMFIITTTLFPISVTSESVVEQHITTTSNNYLKGIWVVQGVFKYIDENDDYIRLKVIGYAIIFGHRNLHGLETYLLIPHNHNNIIEFSKPFHGFLPNSKISMIGFGMCNEWGTTFPVPFSQ